MNEILKKIDEEIEQLNNKRNELYQARKYQACESYISKIAEASKIKSIIQSEQKGSCEYEILHSQLMETEKSLLDTREERDFWELEAKKWCSQLSELRYKIKQQMCEE